MRRLWTKNEIEILQQIYPDMLTADVAKKLNRTYGSVSSMAVMMQIKKSDDFFKSSLSGRTNKINDIGKNTRFTKNMAGWNKGMKMSDYMSVESIEKVKKKQFKKGQDPHNIVLIGHERVTKDGYVEIKIRHINGKDSKNRNFVLKQRFEYEKCFGKIPEKMMVVFKDGNKLNFDPSNLGLKTMSENMLVNSFCDNAIVKKFLGVKSPELAEVIKKEMPELIELKRNEILLNQKINKKDAVRKSETFRR